MDKLEIKKFMWKHLDNEKLLRTLAELYFRWRDESEYEDFNDYIKVLKTLIPKGSKFVKATKRPFAVIFVYEGWTVTISINNKTINWKGTIKKG